MAADSNDFTASVEVTLTITGGEITGTATVTFTPIDDVVAESDETAQISGTSDGLTVTPATLTIEDNDVASNSIALTASPASVAEGDGTVSIQVTATLDGAPRTDATVVLVSIVGVSAALTDDFTADSDVSLTIPAGELSGSATLSLTPGRRRHARRRRGSGGSGEPTTAQASP